MRTLLAGGALVVTLGLAGCSSGYLAYDSAGYYGDYYDPYGYYDPYYDTYYGTYYGPHDPYVVGLPRYYDPFYRRYYVLRGNTRLYFHDGRYVPYRYDRGHYVPYRHYRDYDDRRRAYRRTYRDYDDRRRAYRTYRDRDRVYRRYRDVDRPRVYRERAPRYRRDVSPRYRRGVHDRGGRVYRRDHRSELRSRSAPSVRREIRASPSRSPHGGVHDRSRRDRR